MSVSSSHTFHIPVMGTGFTIDTPIRVARYGISSVISLVDDILIEQMRQVHCAAEGEPYEEITADDPDPRANRIKAYLNLMHRIVQRQLAGMKQAPFEPGTEITRYFELLPECPLKARYQEMLACTDDAQRAALQTELREGVVAGTIDVNLMSKSDRDVYSGGEKLPPEFSDGMSALRGYATSDVASSIVFSGGINQRLYKYIGEFPDFLPDASGNLKKKVCLKVSDVRSAEVQGQYLAKQGLWVSEFRIESGLNCGGHAFPTNGRLLGPVLEEFRENRERLVEKLFKTYRKGMEARGAQVPNDPHSLAITVQGGIGTADEDAFLRRYYQLDRTGWGTSFLLVPEATNVDDEHLDKLMAATASDVSPSDASPFGVPFWHLHTSASEEARQARIAAGKPGSTCPKGYVRLNQELTQVPVCAASRAYQKLKLEALAQDQELTPAQRERLITLVTSKVCICHDLAGGATRRHGIDPDATPAVCCGPAIINFARIASLEEMVGHIYGRLSLLSNAERKHVFVQELSLYLDYLRKELDLYALKLSPRTPKYFRDFGGNLMKGIEYYRRLAEEYLADQRERFLDDLAYMQEQLETITEQYLQPQTT